MAHAHGSPSHDRFLESVVCRLPRDAVEAMADLRPPFDAPARRRRAVVIHLFEAKAAIDDESKAGSLPDDFLFNEDTWEARRVLDAGGGIRYECIVALFKDLGL